MNIYQLTPIGRKLALNTTNPDTPGWRVIHSLYQLGYGTPDQLSLTTGLSEGEASMALRTLKRKGIVEER